MLRPSVLQKLLTHITQGSIQATLIATKSGEILDYVQKSTNNNLTVTSAAEKPMNIKSLCAIVCSIFQAYQKLSVSLSDNLNFVIIDCDSYRMAIRPLGNHIVCICADQNIGLGVLKLKMNSLCDNLAQMLSASIY